MKVLGIDPGSRNCGYAIVESNFGIKLIEAGFIKIASRDLQSQILEFVEGIDLILQTHIIDSAAMENIFYAYNPQSVLKLAQMRGAISLKILQELGNFAEYTPLQVKKAITGKAKSNKMQVAFMVKQILGIKKEIKPLDITDAMAVAITHARMLKSKNIM